MKVINILHDSIVDGPGFRSVVFFAGCPHRCHGCHNPQSWNIDNGTDMSRDEIVAELIENELTQVTLSGGDPFFQSQDVSELAKKLKISGKNIWCYTGYLFEDLLANPHHRLLLEQIDVLVDGPFEMSKRDLSLLYKGSSNQRIIDVPRSLNEGRIHFFEN
ncbi:anaerobic ribonucleoside-triphosphate reductase activating protein [Bacillus marasmi]|uniref:anaerobic ribonucleoside-triphosphate reductase activating protein n=1 Tax=Bacillus marasmi TaxID=1926279 RepID=UPI0011C9EC83|nr:anaerobic ribonucleoside-triphosphate reductase activating protein [Bacillus marasmi]